MPQRLSPASGFVLALLVAAALLSLVISFAMRQPALGLQLRWDDAAGGARVLASHGPAAAIPEGTLLNAVTAGGDYLALARTDLVAEPASALPTLSAYDAFLARQEALSRLQAQPSLTFIDSTGHPHALTPLPSRGVFTLPVEFWVQLAVGLFAWLIAAGVWIFRREEASARYLLLSGLSTLVFAPFAAVYSTRELALPGEQFRWLCDLNFLGGCLYSAAMLALLWYYPKRLGRLALGPLVIAAFGLWWVAQELRFIDSMFMGRRSLVLLALLATVALGVAQWRGTRRDPVARAALQWFLLAWLLGTTLFAALIFVPQVFGVRTDHLQGYAFLLFLLVYGGLAFGILRFRLFNLGEWWFRILLWVIGAIVFVVLDLFLLLMLNLGSTVSLSLSLLVCGFLWLPLRGWLWTRLVQKNLPQKEELFRRVLDISLSISNEERSQRWHALLTLLFDPLEVDVVSGTVSRPQLHDDGLRLALPAQGAQVPALQLSWPEGGRRLFTPRDVALANEIIDMLRHADASRDAYNQGVREERTRIARDLHDDIGARLLDGLHQDDIRETREAIRQAITEMRTLINGLTGADLQLDAAIAELRHEASLRLEAAGITLDWPPSASHAEQALDFRRYRHYLSMVREIISNIIRHSAATAVQVSIHREAGHLVTTIRDNGHGLDSDSTLAGKGFYNLQGRAAELGGRIDIDSASEGTCLRIEFPLTALPANEQEARA
ncbi:MAG: yxjM [Moraxellaceae bacterium]|jgi:signal transduction histidine kinase|nr:yxjM [Moraxellaceae bacterium]